MSCKIMHIQQPYSGEFTEKIYDIPSRWNSSDWTWIKFEEDDDVWCGEFRGQYRASTVSDKMGIIVVLTSDCMFILDLLSKEMIDYLEQPRYIEMTCTPFGDILLNNSFNLDILKGKHISDLDRIMVPVCSDFLEFGEYQENILKIICKECCDFPEQIELLFDCASLDFIGI